MSVISCQLDSEVCLQKPDSSADLTACITNRQLITIYFHTTSCFFSQTTHMIWKNGLKNGNIQISESENT